MRRTTLIIFLFICYFIGQVNGQEVSVRAVLDTNKGLIGDQFRLKFIVEKPVDAWQVTFPSFGDSLVNNLEILTTGEIDTSISGSRQLLTREFLITVFDTGFFEIPSMPFGVSNAALTDTLNSLPLYIEIQAMKADSTIRDIKGIYRVPVGFREIAPYLLGIIVLALLTWVVVRYFKNKPVGIINKKENVRLEPADVFALRELAILKDEKPWLNNKIKYYYSRVSDILRTYIEQRFELLAMEQTTGEILAALANRDISRNETARLAEILKLSDLVKFAKAIPDPEQNVEILVSAETFVLNTKSVPIAEPVAEPNTR